MSDTNKKEYDYSYSYPKPAVAVDCVVFGFDDGDLKVLLIQRDTDSFKGKWALPGGFVNIDESLENAARHELQEETSISGFCLEQLYSFGNLNRDPRGRIITVSYYALVNIQDHQVHCASDARSAAWFSIRGTPSLAFDHDTILQVAHQRLKGKVAYQPICFDLLPKKFTLSQLQHLYDVILEKNINKHIFHRKLLAMELLEETDKIEEDVAHCGSRLYRFDREKYEFLQKQGFSFEI